LIFQKIEELNINQIRDEIIRLEELIAAKTSKLSNAFDSELASVESQNKELKNAIEIEKENIDSIITNNIKNVKEEFSSLENDTLKKLQTIEQKVLQNFEEEKRQREESIAHSISNLNIEELKNTVSVLENDNLEKVQEIKNSIAQLEKMVITRSKELSSAFDIQLESIKSQNEELKNAVDVEKENTKTFLLANVEIIEKGISEFEKDALNRLQESEQKLLKNLEDERKLRERFIVDSISSLNIDDIKKNISNLELSNSEKLQKVENILNQKIEELNYSDTIKSIENSILEQKKRILNAEHIGNSINKKVEELDSINQRKLDKVKKEQEKFIIKKINELDNTQEITELKTNLQKIVDKTQYLETLMQETNKKSLLDMQDYVEKRILRMKYATTIQQITREIAKLNKKINLLQSAQDSEDEQKANIEYIVEQKLAQREKELMKNVESIIEERVQKTIKEILKKQKAKKEQASIAKREIANSIHNTRRKSARNAPTSLDDMVSTLQKRSSTTRNTMSTLNKSIRKSQILNSND